MYDRDETTERVEGPTPGGGAYAMVYYRDAEGEPVPKSEAEASEVIEYDEGGAPLKRTYGRVGRNNSA